MRVLNTLIDPRVGGPQIRSLAIAKQLRKQGIDTEFLIPDGNDSFENRAKTEGFKVHRPGIKRLLPPKNVLKNALYCMYFPLSVKRIRKVIQSQDVDIVHANMPLNFESALATALSDARLVWHFNDVLMPWPITRVAGITATQLADKIVVASGAVHDHYFESIPTETTKLYAPVNIQEFNPDEVDGCDIRQELGLDGDTAIVGSIGNINPVKGHEYLMRAAERVESKTERPVAVLVAGAVLNSQSKHYKRLKQIRKDLDLEDTVHFLGYRSDVAELLSEFDVFVLSSTAEAFPMSVLEAMAMRKPVVATDVGGVPEQVNDGVTGRLVPSKNPTSLASAILEALDNNEESQKQAENARKKVTETYSLEHCVERHIRVYRKVLNQS